ncbi:MAG: tRNA pseudouridine(55) synthase TruB [Sedimenticola sp.]|uniref:tRNA pseudouridine synthase B n=1 Tax=Sedimenticola thiotaurini TaxID=1543721 RepID=A0A558D2A1_9GAMM|nr:tRNA pseudouridine(55) synthase TruB [Sedimenticola sp.]TVT55142.1 MAG: tRNA pseudouridine(55) synthase TruB [Sedimenticola thiotaurini]MCW8880928.1 tRNA pseudouridine(55) synthase TruB [Sedimenticola sp.]MCW8947674.1 tRNA pseudouridine(55) synthase TruB [Sedimenticola sp.]MCW8949256.1 tRNA pseudouridine(55) synthase TruB [Sedimenticola sp.]
MGRRRQRGRNVQGILLFDKPLGESSNKALQKVKQLYYANKAGHTGSLDPLATGLLPICFGGATKVSAFLLDADKRYWVRIKLGETTATGDSEGELLQQRSTDSVTQDRLLSAVDQFLGPIKQIPPMYSALKHQGERLYKLAREGVEVEREPRQVTIHEIKLVKCELPEFELEVHCSKGTYIRTLAEDIGETLGCGAHVIGLRRTQVGPFSGEKMIGLETLQQVAESGNDALDALLLPVDSAIKDWPEVRLNSDSAFYLGQGQPVIVPKAPTEGRVRIYDHNDKFLGVGEILEDGRVAPKRMI